MVTGGWRKKKRDKDIKRESKREVEREQALKMEATVFYNLRVTCHHLCHILFIKANE